MAKVTGRCGRAGQGFLQGRFRAEDEQAGGVADSFAQVCAPVSRVRLGGC